jgi:hypothetical protein
MIKLLFGFDQKKGLELVLEILTKKKWADQKISPMYFLTNCN